MCWLYFLMKTNMYFCFVKLIIWIIFYFNFQFHPLHIIALSHSGNVNKIQINPGTEQRFVVKTRSRTILFVTHQ